MIVTGIDYLLDEGAATTASGSSESLGLPARRKTRGALLTICALRTKVVESPRVSALPRDWAAR
jgi:hypothetical protein